MHLLKSIAGILLMTSISSCGNQVPTENTSTTTDSILYTMDSVGIRKGYASGDTVEASIVYPVITTQSVLADTLRKYIQRDFSNAPNPKASLDSFVLEYETFAKDMAGIGRAYGWTSQTKTTLLPPHKGHYTLRSFGYNYSGGAHGNYATALYTFTPAGKLLRWTDILLPNGEAALQPLIQKAVTQHLQLPDTTSVKNMGLLIDTPTIPLPDQFALTQDGLLLIYNPYEIAAYAVGQIEITIPYAQLTQVVKEEFR
jgi:hypothetical protein